MSKLKAYKYRLYPTKKQAVRLQEVLDRTRELYNAALQERKDAYRMAHVSIGYTQQAAQLTAIKEIRPEYADIHSQVLQDTFGAWIRRSRRFFAASNTEKSLATHGFKPLDAIIASPFRSQALTSLKIIACASPKSAPSK